MIGSAEAANIAAVNQTVTNASLLRVEVLSNFTLAEVSEP